MPWLTQCLSHKTKDYVRIPLIDKAKSMIDPNETKGKIFKVLTNQKTNTNLKEIMAIAGIQKTISFNCARYTFATVGLTVGIPMEVISKLLGLATGI